MFKLLVLLALIYCVLKIINTRAKFAAADAKREAEEEQERLKEQEIEEEAEIRAEAVDVETETLSEDAGAQDVWENDWSIEE